LRLAKADFGWPQRRIELLAGSRKPEEKELEDKQRRDFSSMRFQEKISRQ
jgi:hypothetical protein